MIIASSSTLRAWYLWLLYGGLLTSVLGFMVRPSSDDMFSAVTLIYPGVGALVAGHVCAGVLLYRCWRCVAVYTATFDSRRRPIDPAGAVVLTMTPLVNLVGMFFTLRPLPGELNWLAKAADVEGRAPEDLGTGTAVVSLCALIPVFGLIFGLVAGLVLLPYLLVSCSRVADSIETRLSPSAKPAILL